MRSRTIAAAITGAALLLTTAACGLDGPAGLHGTVTARDQVWRGKAAWQYWLTVKATTGATDRFEVGLTAWRRCAPGAMWPTCK